MTNYCNFHLIRVIIGIISVSPVILTGYARTMHSASHRSVQFINHSGRKTEIYWIDPKNGDLVLQTPEAISSGESLFLHSFVNHTFFIREAPDTNSDSCNPGTAYAAPSLAPCKTAFVTVNDHDDGVFHILKDISVKVKESSDDVTEVQEDISKSITSECHARVIEQIRSNKKYNMNPNDIIDEYEACAKPLIVKQIEESTKEIHEQASLRLDMAQPWEDYTCADFHLPTTTPERKQVWRYNGKEYAVGVLLDRDTAKVHYVKNFITPEECAAIEAAAGPSLHKATVADGAGGSHLQKSRKALQAGVRVPWDKEQDGDPIAAVSRRLYTYINDATGYNIQEAGQEDLMSIQYFGRGLDDPEPDRYMPHCDGQCDGLKFQSAGRVATMVMYCEAPAKGGATNFRNVGIHVVPEVGTAAFFSYLGSNGKTDDRLTEHSCCPVLEGNKKIAVQWVRLGVDEMNPWDSYNTLNIKIGSE